MKIAILTNTSDEIKHTSKLTVSNKYEYCERHNYALIVNNEPYDSANMDVMRKKASLLNIYDMVWALDSDALITNMTIRVEELSCLGPHMTVCPEGITKWSLLNCGSTIWKKTDKTFALLKKLHECIPEWKAMPCGWQSWLQVYQDHIGDAVTIAPLRSFNSCVWNMPGGGIGTPGSNWQHGDFVCHANGIFPYEPVRRQYLELISNMIVR